MNALAKTAVPDAIQLNSYLAALTFRACQYAKAAVLNATDALLRQDHSALQAVQESEGELDRIDREFDERIAEALAHSVPEQAHELLAYLKFILDLERITDLVAGFATRAQAVGARLRNLVLIRHLDGQSPARLSESIQVVAMAQCLERAGDHVKNLAEEVCHLVTGHSLRHVTRAREKSAEQMYLEHLRRRHTRAE
jgi:phosphate uptake regulator